MDSIKQNKPVVLVTGGAGLIGSSVIEALADEYIVIGLDVEEPERRQGQTEFIKCDLTREESIIEALSKVFEIYGSKIASVIHLATYCDFSGQPSDMYQNLTVEGTFRLLNKLREFQIEQFVFLSSVLVMGAAREGEEITESSPLEEKPWDYPRSMIEAEKILIQERADIQTVVLRVAGVYDAECHFPPIAQQIARIYEKRLESYFYAGDKTNVQAFVHLNDLSSCIRLVVNKRDELRNEVFLIAETDLMSYEELQEQLGQLIHGEEWSTISIPKVIAKVGAWAQEKIQGEEDIHIKPWMVDLADAHYPVAIKRASENLNWEPQHQLRDTLPEIIGKLKLHPRRWYQANGLHWPFEENEENTSPRTSAA